MSDNKDGATVTKDASPIPTQALLLLFIIIDIIIIIVIIIIIIIIISIVAYRDTKNTIKFGAHFADPDATDQAITPNAIRPFRGIPQSESVAKIGHDAR